MSVAPEGPAELLARWGVPRDADLARTERGTNNQSFAVVHGARRQTLRADWFTTPEAFRDYFNARYGPVIAAYRSIAGDPDAVSALDDDLADLARRYDHGTTATVMDWEYLLLTARKRA